MSPSCLNTLPAPSEGNAPVTQPVLAGPLLAAWFTCFMGLDSWVGWGEEKGGGPPPISPGPPQPTLSSQTPSPPTPMASSESNPRGGWRSPPSSRSAAGAGSSLWPPEGSAAWEDELTGNACVQAASVDALGPPARRGLAQALDKNPKNKHVSVFESKKAGPGARRGLCRDRSVGQKDGRVCVCGGVIPTRVPVSSPAQPLETGASKARC